MLLLNHPGSHVSPRLAGSSPIRNASPGSRRASPRVITPSLPVGAPRFVHVHGVTVPADIKFQKDQLNIEIRLATANRRRMLDEMEIRRLERQLEEIRELERQQKSAMQKRLASSTSRLNQQQQQQQYQHLTTSPTLRSALQQAAAQRQLPQVSFGTAAEFSGAGAGSPYTAGAPVRQPRLLEASRWPAQKYPLQKQFSDPALFSPLHVSFSTFVFNEEMFQSFFLFFFNV